MLTTPGFAPGVVFWILAALAKDVAGAPLAVRNSGLAAVFTALKLMPTVPFVPFPGFWKLGWLKRLKASILNCA